jgi:hypothetical protein
MAKKIYIHLKGKILISPHCFAGQSCLSGIHLTERHKQLKYLGMGESNLIRIVIA